MTSRRQGRSDRGFMMVAILIGMGVAAIMMTAALPWWRQQVQRTREEELIFRGEQYARAIALFAIKNRGAYPPSIDVLVQQRFLRKKWKDPVTNDDFMPVGIGIVSGPGQGPMTPVGGLTPTPAGRSGGQAPMNTTGQPGVSGVRSKSMATSIKVYQQQQQHNLWAFDASLYAQMKWGLSLASLSQQQGGRQGGPQQGPGRGGQQGPGAGRGGLPMPGRGGDQGPGRGVGPGQGPGRTGTPPLPPTGPGRGRGL